MKAVYRFAFATSVALIAASPATANHSWGGYHWPKGSGELAVPVDDNVSSQWDSYLQIAVLGGRGANAPKGWNNSTSIQSRLTLGTTNPATCDPVLGRIEVCNSTYGPTGWLGLASLWLAGGHISQATTMLNDTYFNSAPYNAPAWRRLVTCQEVGHDYGLDHQDVAFDNYNLGTCMDYTPAPGGGVASSFNYGPSNEYPNLHDFDELSLIYGHLDSRSATLSAGAAQGFRDRGVSGKSMKDWGRAVHIDGAGRPDVFLLDFGGGYRKVTHVFWVPGIMPRS